MQVGNGQLPEILASISHEPNLSNVLQFKPLQHDDFKLVGDEFPYIVAELAVRMRGQFDLPRVMVLAT